MEIKHACENNKLNRHSEVDSESQKKQDSSTRPE